MIWLACLVVIIWLLVRPPLATLLTLALLVIVVISLAGCGTYHAQTGPWSEPMIKGKTGMPNGPKPIDQYGCYHGPTPTYPTPIPLTCIREDQRWDPYEERTSPRTWGI